MKKFRFVFLFCLIPILSACDLHPKITNLPDSVGNFIETRYPALLADPDSQPEIYNSAATDYGVYASPELYGGTTPEDYVLYASVDDYIIPPSEPEPESEPIITHSEQIESQPLADISDEMPTDDFLSIPRYTQPKPADKSAPEIVRSASAVGKITVVRGDTLYSLARAHGTTVDAIARENNIVAPYSLRIGQTLKLPSTDASAPKPEIKAEQKIIAKPEPKAQPQTEQPKPEKKQESKPTPTPKLEQKSAPKPNTTTRVDLTDIIVASGDTLYSISRKYAVPVNDLAVINNMSAPFALRAGQKIKVPNVAAANARTAVKTQQKTQKTVSQKTTTKTTTKTTVKPQTSQTAQKISSDPKQKLPKIAARSASKFSWPVRGKILSAYGTKSTGLFNDGINISASAGTIVRAAENGVVAYAGNEVKGMGNLIIIQHSDGWMTVYAHLDSMALRRGARVNVGDKIGTVGKTGKVSEPQLHFEIRRGTKSYNPTKYLK